MTAGGRLGHSRAVLLMVLAALLWSIAGVVARQIESATRFEITFWRSAFAALSLLVILPLWRRSQPRHGDLPAGASRGLGLFVRRHWGLHPEWPAFWISGLCWSVMFSAFMLAMTFTSVANVLVIMALGPLFTALLARVTTGLPLPLRTWLTAVMAGAGIAFMYGSQFAQALAGPQDDASNLVAGSLIALGVPIGGAVNWTVAQRSQQHGARIDLVPAVLLGATLSSLALLPLAWPFAATGGDIAWLATLGLVQLAIPCTLAVVSARVLSAPEVSLLALLEVIFGIALVWIGAGEAPGPNVITGGGAVIVALAINEALGWHSRQGTPRIQTLEARDDPAP